MTHKNLSAEQLAKITSSTQFGRLPNLEDVSNAVHFLCSAENSGVTGQFIKIDLGFSDVRIV
jgi:enoyl-[acyl-carrier-protein] reductase (NADH)